MRGLAFSLDALFALGFVAVILSLPIVLSNSGEAGLEEISVLARDYLVLKHYYNQTITPANFSNLTSHTLNESEPTDTAYTWAYATYYKYPNFFNCSNSTSCSFANASDSANYTLGQDLGLTHKYAVWVRP